MNTTHRKENTTGLIRKWFTRGVACMALLFAAGSVQAASYTNTASGNWWPGSTTIWSNGVVGVSDTDTIIVFNPKAADTSTINTNAAFTLNQLQVVPNQIVTLQSTNGSSLKFVTSSAGTLPSITNAGTSTLTINSPITLANNLTVGAASSGAITINSNITESAMSSITKLGTNTLAFYSSNTFSGGMNILNGRVNVGATNALGSGLITLGDSSGANSATLIQPGPVTTIALTNSITVAAGSSGTLSILSAGVNLVLSGPVALNNNLTVSSANQSKYVTFSGLITEGGSSPLTITHVNGGGINSAATFSGGVTINSGGLIISNNAGGTGAFTIGTGNITGSGPLTLNANNASPITVSAPVINNSGSITNSGTGTGTTTISGNIGANVTDIVQNNVNSTLTLSGTNTFTGNLYIKAGTLCNVLGGQWNYPANSGNFGPGTGTIYLGDATVGADATLALQDNAAYSPSTTPNSTNLIVVVSGGGARTIRVRPNASAQSWLGGNITLSNNLQFIYDNKTFNGNNLKISGNISGTGNLTFASASTIGNCSISLTGASSNPVGAITNSSQGTNNISISGAIGANVTAVVQNGATSTLTLSGTNNLYAGTTTVLLGKLETTKTNSLGVASSVVIATDNGDAKMYLNFTGTNTITSLKLGNVNMPKGIYGTNAPSGNLIFSGLGKLKVLTGPANGTLISVY